MLSSTTTDCPPGCVEHPEHVYVICYGQPVYVSDRDFLPGETADYPISHYVGHTRQQPPVRRVRAHGNRSAHHLIALAPGTPDDEERLKTSGHCPGCGGRLWYYATPAPAHPPTDPTPERTDP